MNFSYLVKAGHIKDGRANNGKRRTGELLFVGRQRAPKNRPKLFQGISQRKILEEINELLDGNYDWNMLVIGEIKKK